MYSKNFGEIDHKYQQRIESNHTFSVDNTKKDKPTYYVLDMFAYPSGVGLHLGHALTYTATDIRARVMRLLGYEVLYPVGFDSFGLPTENYAMKVGKTAQDVTIENTDNFRKQLKKLAISYDWDREIITSEKDFYKWTQWVVLQLWENGLLYKKLSPVNWCPACQTVLANEQVVDGKCERDDSEVEQKEMLQWFVNITKYADELVDGLDDLDWPEASKKLQKNWIGRRIGYEYTLASSEGVNVSVFSENDSMRKTIHGVAIALEHPLAAELANKTPGLTHRFEQYRKEISMLTPMDRYEKFKERSGFFTGIYLSNPLNDEKIPLFVSGNINKSSGEDSVILSPNSLKRDSFIFENENVSFNNEDDRLLTSEEIEALKEKGTIAEAKKYRLRDWSISRQRFWGSPMPFIENDTEGTQGVDESELPVVLPGNVQNYRPSGVSPLAQISEFLNTHSKSGIPSVRECDTLDTFVDSSFYYLRYLNPHDAENFLSPEAIEKWGDVGIYIGGKEHITAHLIYARFIHKFLHSIGVVKSPEPFKILRHQGVILDSKGVKMSKRLGNVVNPVDVINQYGTDTLRVYLMFMGPLADGHVWSTEGIDGVSRFLDRVYKFLSLISPEPPSEKELQLINKLSLEIKEDTLGLKYNTAVSKFMIFVNEIYKLEKISEESFKKFIILIYPYAPNLANCLWEEQGFEGNIDQASFPEYDEKIAKLATVHLAVQINGKTRGILKLENENLTEDEVLSLAHAQEDTAKYLKDQIIKRVVYRAGKVLNIVI